MSAENAGLPAPACDVTFHAGEILPATLGAYAGAAERLADG